jgi:hypothetical protein
MKQYIILIIVIIILIFLHINYEINKENFEMNSTQRSRFNRVIKKIIKGEQINIPLMNISEVLSIKYLNYGFRNMLAKFRYPVGSYYVQFPNISGVTGLDSKQFEVLSDVFPESQAPYKLFGGRWINVWNRESIYFRTGKTTNIAYETYNGVGSRNMGLQDYAMPKIDGWTIYSQSDSRGTNNDYYTGVFTKNDTYEGMCDDGAWGRTGVSYKFDTRNVIPANTSEDEIVIKNRQFKIWKRVS